MDTEASQRWGARAEGRPAWMNQPRFSGTLETDTDPQGVKAHIESLKQPPRPPTLAPHMQRVVDEWTALGEKLAKYDDFIDWNYLFRQCSENEQDRLRRQQKAMREYLNILGERILAFPTPG